jgi:hypothetical protein
MDLKPDCVHHDHTPAVNRYAHTHARSRKQANATGHHVMEAGGSGLDIYSIYAVDTKYLDTNYNPFPGAETQPGSRGRFGCFKLSSHLYVVTSRQVRGVWVKGICSCRTTVRPLRATSTAFLHILVGIW